MEDKHFMFTITNVNQTPMQMIVFLLTLFILTSAVNNLPTRTFQNRSLSTKLLSNRTSTLQLWKKFNAIATSKKLIASRQNTTRADLRSLSTNTTPASLAPSISTWNVSYLSTTQANVISFLSASRASVVKSSSNAGNFVIVFVCCFSVLLFVSFIFTYLLREHIHSTYFKLPCIHSLSTTKQSRDSIPLSYSPIHTTISANVRKKNDRYRYYSKSIKARCVPKKARRQCDEHLSQSRFTVPEEFPVEQLYDVYMQKHALDDLAFSIEFKSIPNFDELSCTSATRATVASKNRFLNILPIDATRVILRLLNDDPATDYINGNYISGYQCENKFIATQGPKPDTCEDFWRMIWELNLKSIVMLTNIIEGASRMTKCHQYWPELNQTIIYGCYQITCHDIQCLCDYEKRSFQLSRINDDKEFSSSSSVTTDDASSLNSGFHEQAVRTIVQYHYTQWKDMDVPNDSHTLIHLIQEVNEQTNSEQYPIVVHCTAGVGRTGTYIAIDAMMEKIKQERKVNIYQFISQMRRERHLMVQTVKQYVFIYRSLLEYYLFGNTRIAVNQFRSMYSNLTKNKRSLLVQEFQKLPLLPVENVSHFDAHQPENIGKNRNTQIVPYNHNRVCLSRILGHPYINASFIEGYTPECSFIITQDPLSETTDEFWRMFIEHNSNCIVQLHTREEVNERVTYYPDDIDTTMRVGTTGLLKLTEKEILAEKFVMRQFCLTDTRDALSKTIYHYEYLLPISTTDERENGQCLPTISAHNLFDFLGHINKRPMNTHPNRYITVHCGNGGPSCSLFCMSVILLDQLKNEHAVDVFQRVRALQRQRPAMITSFAQYECLYEMLLQFLEESYEIATGKSSPSLNNSIYDND